MLFPIKMLMLHSLIVNMKIHIFELSSHHLSGNISNSHNDQLPFGLIAQLVERCTGIAEVMGSNPVQA